MSVISFSNQFSGCFSHNSGEFLVGTRTGDPFIPCLPPPTVPWCTTVDGIAGQERARSLYTMPASPPRDRYRRFLASAFLSTAARAKTWNSLGTDFSVLLDPSEGLVKHLPLFKITRKSCPIDTGANSIAKSHWSLLWYVLFVECKFQVQTMQVHMIHSSHTWKYTKNLLNFALSCIVCWV